MTVRSPGRRRSVKIAIAVLITMALAVLGLAAPATASAADDPPTPIHIAGTGEIGAVNIHTAPSTSSAVVGDIPEGVTPDYTCFEYGDDVNGVPIWFSVTYDGVSGFYASAYDDAHYGSDDELTQKYGVARCGDDGPPYNIIPQGSTPSSVFFSPISHEPHGHGTGNIATTDLELEAWKPAAECDTTKAAAAVPAGTSVLSGWSLGRLGPLYYLKDRGPEEAAKSIKTIVLYDPGSTENFSYPSCDGRVNANELLARWLKASPDTQLIILTGHDSEEKNLVGEPKFNGLWSYYLAGIWNQDFADRAMICDYDEMEHFDVLNEFRDTTRLTPSSCPAALDGTPATEWHP